MHLIRGALLWHIIRSSVIAMAGTTVCMSPVAMMIHNPMTIAIGDSEEIKKAVYHIRILENVMDIAYGERYLLIVQ